MNKRNFNLPRLQVPWFVKLGPGKSGGINPGAILDSKSHQSMHILGSHHIAKEIRSINVDSSIIVCDTLGIRGVRR
jgi:hypothetical protein